MSNRPMVDPNTAGQNYVNGMRTKGVENYKKGIQRLTVSPTQLAKAQKGKMLANTMAAIQDGRWEQGLDKISLQQYQQLAGTKGAANILTGATAAQGKVSAYLSSKGAQIQALRDQIAEARRQGANGKRLSEMWQDGIRQINGLPPQ